MGYDQTACLVAIAQSVAEGCFGYQIALRNLTEESKKNR